MYFANFRTTTINESTTQAQVKRWAMKFSAPKSELEYGDTLTGFMMNLESIGTKEVYFHDLDFSGNFIVQWLMKNDFTPVDILDKDANGKRVELSPKQWRYVCNEKSGIYIISVQFENGVETNFIDSWKSLTSSYQDLKEAAGIKEDFGLDLFDDFTDEKKRKIQLREMEEEIDAVIFSFIKMLKKNKKRLTRSSMSFDDFKDFYNKEHKSNRAFAVDFGGKLYNYKEQEFKPHNVLSTKEWNYVHKSFSGGWNSWKIGIEDKLIKVKNGYVYDANAMHTSIAMQYELPYGKLLKSKPLSGAYAKLLTLNISKARKKVKGSPNLIRVKNNRYAEATYTDSIDFEERVYWEEEWEFILRHYHIDYTIVSEKYFRVKSSMKTWLENKAENETNYGSKVDKTLSKGGRNGFIGKTAQGINLGSRAIIKDGFQVSIVKENGSFVNPLNEEILISKGDRVLVDNLTGEIYMKISHRYSRYGKNGEYTHKVRFEESEQRNHIGLGSYVYMKARICLWNVVYANLDIWLYSDSDSGFFADEPRGIKVHSTKFGFWKPQNKFDYFKVIRGKAYMFRSTAYWKGGRWVKDASIVKKVSGLNPEGKSSLNFENFHQGHVVKNGKNMIMNVDGGKIRYRVDFTLGNRGDQ